MGILKPRTTSVVIYQGDDLEHLAELHREVQFATHAADQLEARREAAQKSGRPSRVGDDVVVTDEQIAEARAKQRAAEAAYDAVVTEAADRAVAVDLEEIGSLRFNDLVRQHEPRTDLDGKGRRYVIEADEEYGVNADTMPRALLTFHDEDSGRRTITGPPEVLEDVVGFVDDMSAGDLARIFDAAYWLNRSRGIDPKATMFSTDSPRSDEN